MFASKQKVFAGLLFLQLIAVAVSDNAYLGERFRYYARKLINTSQVKYSPDAYTSCGYVDVCESDLTKIVWTNDSDIFPPFQVNTSLVAHKLVDGANVANEINEICFADTLQDDWENELRYDQYGALAWQYIGFSEEGSYSYFPMSNWSDAGSCPGTYDPRLRAWYLSAISGPLNMMIMIDVSRTGSSANDELRLSRQLEAARDLLGSLNYWSFFNIGVYTDSISFFGSSMERATADNLLRAENYLNNLNISTDQFVSFETALVGSFQVLQNSINGGDSSLCHSMVIVLATDHNDISSTTNVDDIVDSYDFESGETVVLPFVFNFQSAIVDPVYEETACHSNGFHRVFTDSSSANSASKVLTSYSSYLSATLQIDAVRYSEIYVDALGLGEMTTGAIPLYDNYTDSYGTELRTVVGVYGIDVLVSGLNNGGTISNADIMSSLATLSKCPAMHPTDDILLSFREGGTCELALATTDYGGGGEHPLEKNKWKYDLIASFGLIGSLSFCLIVVALLRNDTNTKVIGASFIAFFHITFGIALVAYTLSTTWEDTVRNKHWEDSTMTVLSAVIDPSTCCNVVNCVCANHYGNTCGSLVDNYQEGYCDNGYHCCQTETYECNCEWTDDGGRECDTCTRCTLSVNNRQCEVVCQECYTGKVVWSYHPEESDTPIILEYSKYCNKGTEAASLQCAEDYVADYSVGSEHAIIYNPLDLLETEEGDNDMPGNYYTVIVAMAVCLGLSYLILLVLCVMQPRKESYSTKRAQESKEAAMQMSSVPPPNQPQYISQQQPPPAQYGQVPTQYVSHQQMPPPATSMTAIYSQQVQQPQYVQTAQFTSVPQYTQPTDSYVSAPPAPKYQEEEMPPAPKYQEMPPPPKYQEEDLPPPPAPAY